MNDAEKHIDSWSMTDVQRYLNGELSAREKHDLEKQALDDPFLADALEGLQTQSGETLHQDLTELRTRLDTRVATHRKRSWLPPMRAAAVVILLVGLGFTAYRTLFYKGQPVAGPVATHEAPAPPTVPPSTSGNRAAADSAVASAAAAPAQPARDWAPAIAAIRPTRHPANKPRAEGHVQPTESRVQPAATTAAATDIAASEDVLKSVRIPDNLTIRKDTTPYLANVDGSKAGVRIGSSANLGASTNLVVFSGRVLDPNHRPVAGASLLVKNGNTGAVTDQKGEFNLYIPQKDTTRQLTVAMEGFEETQYALNTEDRKGNTIILHQSPASLQQVVVSGVGAKRKEYMAAPPSDVPETLDSLWLNTAPTTGRVAYLNYLATASKTLPVDTAIHGIESISFKVDKKGALTEFKIERSLSPAHDAGVIRLITEGSPWEMLHGKTARALVNVIFP